MPRRSARPAADQTLELPTQTRACHACAGPLWCQWTRIVTRLVNPNCYEVRGFPAWDGFLQDRPGFSVFSGVFGFLTQGLLVPPRANRGQGFGPESLRVPAVSTLGLLHDRGPSEPACSRP